MGLPYYLHSAELARVAAIDKAQRIIKKWNVRGGQFEVRLKTTKVSITGNEASAKTSLQLAESQIKRFIAMAGLDETTFVREHVEADADSESHKLSWHKYN